MGERITVMLDDGCSEILQRLAGSSRKQGEYLSGILRGLWENQKAMQQGLDLESLRYQILGVAGEQHDLANRVFRLERTVAAMIADSATSEA